MPVVQSVKTNRLELLAPAGNLETFWAAVEKKADAVYIGWSNFNARVQAENFSLQEISRMIPFAHKHGVKVYLALNILFKEGELPKILEGLRILREFPPDALIIQDMGLYYLLKNYFPDFHLHGSTLMTIHNHLGAGHLLDLGFERVVLARELSIGEIAAIHRHCPIELEVFVQGALCYSFSGLCLMSSYLGGKSSMRGRCVQPCRRLYESGKNRGFFFSMNDLSAIRLLPELKKAGVSAIKLEGRMRSAHYVSSIVEAYRTVLDAPEGQAEALERAELLIREGLGRKPTPGYFFYPHMTEITSPHHSGTAGLFLGKIIRIQNGKAVVKMAAEAHVGDRLRLVGAETDQGSSFSLEQMLVEGKALTTASRGQEVMLKLPTACRKGDSLFKTDVKDGGLLRGSNRIRKLLFAGIKDSPVQRPSDKDSASDLEALKLFRHPRTAPRAKKGLRWWVKLGDLRSLFKASCPGIDRFLVLLDERTLAQYRRYRKQVSPLQHRFSWMLPPVIEEKQGRFYQEAVNELCRAGFKYWHLGHISQRQFFPSKAKAIHFSASYTANVLNSLSIRSLYDLGITEVEFSMETDLENLKQALAHASGHSVGLTVYGRPPLFTSRLLPAGLKPGSTLKSPRGETFIVGSYQGLTTVHSPHPYSLLAFRPDLERMGLSFAVLDLTWEHPARDMLIDLLEGKPGRKIRGRASTTNTFNFLRTLH